MEFPIVLRGNYRNGAVFDVLLQACFIAMGEPEAA